MKVSPAYPLQGVIDLIQSGQLVDAPSLTALLREAVDHIEKLEGDLSDYNDACASQGLPLGTSVERFIRHYTGNAAMVAALTENTRDFVAGAHSSVATKCLGCEYIVDALTFTNLVNVAPSEVARITKIIHDRAIDAKHEFENKRKEGAS